MNPLTEKIITLRRLFEAAKNDEERYSKIIDFGKTLPPFDPVLKTEENRVKGCQSLMYLHCENKEGRLYFSIDSDALISKGLAALLLYLYNGEEPLTILKWPPHFIGELGIIASLTPSRINGFASLYRQMQIRASHFLKTTDNP